MNKVDVEIFAKRFGDNNVTEMIHDKQFKVLLTISDDEAQSKSQFIIDREQASCLISRLQKILNNQEVKNLGFNFV